MIYIKVKAYCTAKLVNTEEILMRGKSMVSVNKNSKMEMFTKVNTTWITIMEQANIHGVMELFMRVILLMIRCQEREPGYQNTEISIKANITKEKDMDMAGIRKEMGKF